MDRLQTIYANQSLPRSMSQAIFLAGPTPRDKDTPSWRPEAIKLLQEMDYKGYVFAPEGADGNWKSTYTDQVDWEEEALNQADVILFWVPREMRSMPALTTNDEWGCWKHSGKVVLGTPPSAEHVRYMQHYADKLGTPRFESLNDALREAVVRITPGAPRVGGECQVPLAIWNRPDFQKWYAAQTRVGNRLDGARVVWSFFVGPKKNRLFLYALHVDVHIASENRNKTNEIVLYRPDISAVLLIQPHPVVTKSRCVLVREFRSPASGPDAMVHELPGGSSTTSEDALTVAVHELAEETGIKIVPTRLKHLGSRQIAATLAAHKAHLWYAEVTESEMNRIEQAAAKREAHGVEGDSERTYVEVRQLGDLLQEGDADWATLGMILTALA